MPDALRDSCPACGPDAQALRGAVRSRIEEFLGDRTMPEIALARRIVEAFPSRARALARVVFEAADAVDPGETARQAHALKGSAMNVGALTLAALCAEVEELSRTGSVDGVIGYQARIEETIAGFEPLLRSVCAEFAPLQSDGVPSPHDVAHIE
jgi:HPt (histidine-containing phosphotransfer) domain-containing protein